MKKYEVELADEERAALKKLIRQARRGGVSARKIARARILLLSDAGASGVEIVSDVGVSAATVSYTRQRFAEVGLAALEDRPRPGQPRRLGEEGEARLAAEARRKPPRGISRWSLRSLARRAEELGLAPTCSHETVRLVLKKNGLSLH